jgi:hypothetical protein
MFMHQSTATSWHAKSLQIAHVMGHIARTATFGSSGSIVIVVIFLLIIRLHDLSYITESLWFEDGNLFINESYQFGFRSLFMPYAGSPFLFHRVVALLATCAPLIAAPYIFFCGWACRFLPLFGSS